MSALVARLDNAGDVLLAGPAVRAAAATHGPVTFVAGPTGAAAAQLLPGVGEVLVLDAPWVAERSPEVAAAPLDAFTSSVRERAPDVGIVLTSWHQSPLPLALLLRLAGVPRLGAVSVDFAGSLLDVRLRVPEDVSDDLHEVQRALAVTTALGLPLPVGDDGRLRVELPAAEPLAVVDVVLHPGASVPARSWHTDGYAALAALLTAEGFSVAVTGGPAERSQTAAVAAAARDVLDLGGATDLGGLGLVLAAAQVVVTGNTGPAHLSAAVGTPVVSVFAPTVPAQRWRPWSVPQVLLGDQGIACAGCRARVCPVPGHPCTDTVPAAEVLRAVRSLVGVAACAS